MKTLVIDASIAVKWVIEEVGTPEALALRQRAKPSDCQFVTADQRFLRKAHQKQRSLRGRIISLNEAAML